MTPTLDAITAYLVVRGVVPSPWVPAEVRHLLVAHGMAAPDPLDAERLVPTEAAVRRVVVGRRRWHAVVAEANVGGTLLRACREGATVTRAGLVMPPEVVARLVPARPLDASTARARVEMLRRAHAA